MKKLIAMSSMVVVMTALFVTPAYARGFAVPRATNMNYTTAANAYPTMDVGALVSARRAYLDSLVSQGVLTPELANTYLANYRNMLEYRAANSGYGYGGGGGCGGGYGGGGMCGGGGGSYGAYGRGY